MTAIKTKTPALLTVALLAMVALFAGPTASAKTSAQVFRVTFAYNPADSAETIYAQLHKTAFSACVRNVPPMVTPSAVRRCTMSVVKSAVSVMDRTDVAELHRVKTS